jgi:hypothetical protein
MKHAGEVAVVSGDVSGEGAAALFAFKAGVQCSDALLVRGSAEEFAGFFPDALAVWWSRHTASGPSIPNLIAPPRLDGL